MSADASNSPRRLAHRHRLRLPIARSEIVNHIPQEIRKHIRQQIRKHVCQQICKLS
jgi:hypothetical protein